MSFVGEGIAFEHPYVLVEAFLMLRLRTGKCIACDRDCAKRNHSIQPLICNGSLNFNAVKKGGVLGNWKRVGAAFLAAGAVSGCTASKQPATAAPVLVGGWSAIDPAAVDVQAIALYAAGQMPSEHGAIAQVERAETQIVAGTNYRLVLHFADDQRWTATVWRQLDGSLALTNAERIADK